MQLLATIVVFVAVLAVTYYVTKWIAKSGAIPSRSKNIRVIETFKIAPNKYVQIIQLGSKYYSIGVTKDTITFLTPLDEDQLTLGDPEESVQSVPFKDMMEKMVSRMKKKDNND